MLLFVFSHTNFNSYSYRAVFWIKRSLRYEAMRRRERGGRREVEKRKKQGIDSGYNIVQPPFPSQYLFLFSHTHESMEQKKRSTFPIVNAFRMKIYLDYTFSNLIIFKELCVCRCEYVYESNPRAQHSTHRLAHSLVHRRRCRCRHCLSVASNFRNTIQHFEN